MITKYKCKTVGCRLYEVKIPDIRCLRAKDGKGRICSECDKRMIVAETINTSGGARGGRRTTSRSRSRSR